MSKQLKAALKEHDITITDSMPAGASYEMPCPKCSPRRTNKSDPCLRVQISADGKGVEWTCRHCLWSDKAGEVAEDEDAGVGQRSSRTFAKPTPPADGARSSMPGDAAEFFQERGISPAVLERNRVSWDEDKQAIAFPYFEGKDLINVKRMDLAGKSWLERDAKPVFYGASEAIVERARAGGDPSSSRVIIVSNEVEKLTLEAAGLANVIAAPHGAQHSKTHDYIVHSAELLERASTVILALDNTKDGIALRAELVRRIGAAKCSDAVFVQGSPADTLMQVGADVMLDCINEATPYPITGLYEVGSFETTLETFFDGGMSAGVSTGYENLDKLFTVMPGEVTVVTGVPNNGKSEVVDAILVNLALQQGWKAAIFSPENGKEGHVTKLVEKRVEMPADPRHPKRMSKDTFLKGASWVGEHFFFIVADDDKDLPTLDWLLDKASAAVLRYGVNVLVIDPWNEIDHQRPKESPNMTETEYISMSLSKLKRFARNHAIHIFVIAHPRSMQTDKDGKLRVPSLYDISGSAHWANKCDNGMVVHRSADISDATEIWMKKVRFKWVGRRGMTTLKYNKDTGRFSVPEDKKREKQEGGGDDQGSFAPLEGDDEVLSYPAEM